MYQVLCYKKKMSTKCELVGVTSIQTDFSMKKNQPPQKKNQLFKN